MFIPSNSLASGYIRNPWAQLCVDDGTQGSQHTISLWQCMISFNSIIQPCQYVLDNMDRTKRRQFDPGLLLVSEAGLKHIDDVLLEKFIQET